MGIQNLLPSLKSIQKTQNVSEFKGQTIGVDGYCWLHQGAYSCAEELVNGYGVEKLVQYCKQKLDVVIESGVRPIIVFDGNKLDIKDGIESQRQTQREQAKMKATELKSRGMSTLARKKFAESIDITPDLAYAFIKVLKD